MLITSNLADTDVNSSVSPELFTIFSSLNRLLNISTDLNISVSYKKEKGKEGKEGKGEKGGREKKKNGG